MPKTILVADDNALVRKMLCKIFEAEDDYDICAEAVNGQDAIAGAARLKPDVILMDVRMPVLDGLQATRQIAATDRQIDRLVYNLYGLSEAEIKIV